MAKYRAFTNDLSSEAVGELMSMSGARLVELPDGLPHLRIEPRVGSGLQIENENINAFGHTGIQASKISIKLAAGGGLSFNGSGELQATGVGTSVTLTDDTTTNATRYLLFEDTTSGTVSTVNVASTKLTFNPSTGVLAASGGFSGNATTATTLATARNINGVSFNGSADITVTAAAGTLTGATLASGVTASSLTSVGTLSTLAVGGATTVTGGSVTVRAAATQDAVILAGRAGGTGSFGVTISPTTLTASRTVTLADGNTTLVAGTMFPTSGGTVTGTVTVLAAATQDAVRLQGRAGGTGSFIVTLTPTTLTASRTLTLADGDTTLVAGTMVPTTRTLTITNGTGITGGGAAVDLSANRSWTIGLTGQALAFHNLASSGLVARTAADTVAARTITGTANQITVTNGDGVAGNPTLSLPADVDITTSLDVGSVGAITAAMVRIGGDLRASGTIYANDFVLTGGSGSGTGLSLDNLDDVVITTPAAAQYLRYSGAGWVNSAIQMADLGTGTSITTKFLRGDGTWQTVSTSGSISTLSDVSLTAAASGDFLRYNGTAWTDATISAADVPSLDTSKLTTGTLGVARGGTGLASYTIGDILYASGASALSALAGVATGNALISGGVGAAPSWGKIGLTTHVSGTLALGNGGTGATTQAGAANAILPSQTSQSGKYLTTDGTNVSWATVTAGSSVTVSDDTTTNAARYILFEDATTGTVSTVNVASTKLTFNPSTGTLATTVFSGSGASLTSLNAGNVSTGTLAVARGGTGLASYTIGDILYASGATTLSALAGVATGNALISGGTGTAPSWGKIGLTTHVSGTLGAGNGGTGISSYTTGNYIYASGTTTLAQRTPTQVRSDISAEFQQTLGVPRANLGDPTVREVAMFDEQQDNKTAFHPTASFWVETSTDGTTWSDAGLTTNQKERLIGGDTGTSWVLPYNTPYVRVRLRATSYSYINALYAYTSTSGHTMAVQIYKKHDNDANWTQHTSSATQVSTWPGHVYMPFTYIPWHNNATQGTHFHEVYVVFIPTWNATYSANGITFYRFQLWGGYPASKRNVYATDEFRNVAFPASISTTGSITARAAATQDAVVLAGRAGGTGSFGVTLTPTTLTASRTVTLADGNTTLVAGTMVATTRSITINGTTNQITSSAGAQDLSADRTWTLSLPQNIHTGATPTFAGLTLTGAASVTGTVTAIAAATQDAVRLQGRAGGTGSFIATITPTTLTASRTLTLADGNTTLVAGTMVPTTLTLTMTGTTNQVTVTNSGTAQDFSANRSWTFSLPQNIHTAATPTFAQLILGTDPTGASLLRVGGAATLTSTVTASDFILSSDARLKTDLRPLSGALADIDRVGAYRYTHVRNQRQEVGVLAQEIQEILPEAVTTGDDGMLAVAYDRLVPLLLAAVKELSARVQHLEQQR